MEQERNVDKLAGWILRLAVFAAIVGLCWYFRSVLVYIIIAFVVSLIGQPLMRLFRRVKIRGKSLPDGLLAVITIVLILAGSALFLTQIVPVVTGIIRDASAMNASDLPYNSLIDKINQAIYSLFPSLGPNYDIVTVILDKIRELLNFSNVSSVIGSVASVAASIVIGMIVKIIRPDTTANENQSGLVLMSKDYMVFALIIFGLIGAKLTYWIVEIKAVIANPRMLLDLGGGVVVYGGIILGILAPVLYLNQ